MFQTRYGSTIYALYKNAPQHCWFLELINQLETLLDKVSLDNVTEKQRTCQEMLSNYDSNVLYQRLSALHTDLLALALTHDELAFPSATGGINLYYNDDFSVTLLAFDQLPEQDNRLFSSVYNSNTLCLQGEMPVRHWQFQEKLTNSHWDRQFPKVTLQEKSPYRVNPGEFLTLDCQAGFNKVDKQKRFVALSIITKPLLDTQIVFEPNTLKPLHMIDANTDRSRSKIILKALPSLARSNCNVEKVIQHGLASNDYTIRWGAIKASVLAETSFAETAVLEGLKDVNDEVRKSCQRIINECTE